MFFFIGHEIEFISKCPSYVKHIKVFEKILLKPGLVPENILSEVFVVLILVDIVELWTFPGAELIKINDDGLYIPTSK